MEENESGIRQPLMSFPQKFRSNGWNKAEGQLVTFLAGMMKASPITQSIGGNRSTLSLLKNSR